MQTANLSQQLEQQAAKFEEAAAKLREAAKILADTGKNGNAPQIEGPGGVNRKEQIAEFLRTHGPATRKEVYAGLPKVPRGTIGAILSRKNFAQDEDGLWTVKK